MELSTSLEKDASIEFPWRKTWVTWPAKPTLTLRSSLEPWERNIVTKQIITAGTLLCGMGEKFMKFHSDYWRRVCLKGRVNFRIWLWICMRQCQHFTQEFAQNWLKSERKKYTHLFVHKKYLIMECKIFLSFRNELREIKRQRRFFPKLLWRTVHKASL